MLGVKVCVVFVSITCVNTARVNISLGELEGSSYFTDTGKEIFTFLGVPYARPPVGKHKFEETKPARNWTGIWPATSPGPACIQVYIHSDSSDDFLGSEDCLFLNIYTPTVSNTSNLPVLVYFHGGAFMFGQSNIYNPSFFHEKYDIVFVSVNYRLGPFGFLSTEDDVVPGNNGLKDQVQALKWIQENIAAFGGDKRKVTISGNSAGGASVHYHYLSPLSRKLFDKGISSSGSALVPWALTEEPLQKAKLLANAVGCPTNTTYTMMKCLKHRPNRQILSKVKPLFMPWHANPFSPFGPVIEKSTTNPFLSEHPYKLLTRGDVYDGPWLAGVTTEEGLYPAATFIDREELLTMLNDDWRSITPHLLDFNYTIVYDKHNRVSDQIKKFYFGDKAITKETSAKVIEMIGDRLFDADMDLAAKLQASVTNSPVFFYRFAHRGTISLSHIFSKTKHYFGVSHFDDMLYIFDLVQSGYFGSIEPLTYKTMVDVMSSLWASFVQTGRPSPLASTSTQWDPVPQDVIETGSLTYLEIKSPTEMVMKETENFGNYQFWNSLEFNENVNFIVIDKYLNNSDVPEIKDEL